MNESSDERDRVFVNPITYGGTSEVESYRIAMCPTCCEPAVSTRVEYLGDRPVKYPCTVECRCGNGHPWRTSWSGESQMIHRDAA